MSLTSMLSGTSERDKVFQRIIFDLLPEKEKFYTLSGKTAFSSEYTLKVPYQLSNPYYASVVGTSFDYLARILIARTIRNNKASSFIDLVAQKGLKIMSGIVDRKIYNRISDKYVFYLSRFIEYVYDDGSKIITEFESFTSQEEWRAYSAFVDRVSKRMYSDKVSIEELCCITCFFAKLERIYRDGFLPDSYENSLLSSPEIEVIDELKKLISVFSKTMIDTRIVSRESVVVFNPTFGPIVSMCVGGADADVYIDGIIYDFKTTKDLRYKRQDVAQILAYYLLYLLSIAIYEPRSSLSGFIVDRIALYKARSGELEHLNTSSLGKDKTLTAIRSLGILFNLKIDRNSVSNIASRL